MKILLAPRNNDQSLNFQVVYNYTSCLNASIILIISTCIFRVLYNLFPQFWPMFFLINETWYNYTHPLPNIAIPTNACSLLVTSLNTICFPLSPNYRPRHGPNSTSHDSNPPTWLKPAHVIRSHPPSRDHANHQTAHVTECLLNSIYICLLNPIYLYLWAAARSVLPNVFDMIWLFCLRSHHGGTSH